MSDLVVNVSKVAFVAALYLFLLFVARAVRGHLTAAAPPASPGSGPVAATLLVRREGFEPRIVEVRRAVVVGRSPDADVVLEDDFASGHHARFEVSGGVLVVEDLGSTNGTLVDERLAPGRVTLEPGDTVRIGETTFEVR